MIRRLVLGLAMVALLPLAPPAAAAVDTTPPTLRTPVKSSFVVGSQLTSYFPDCGDQVPGLGQVWTSVDQEMRWSATDDSGSVSFSYVQDRKGEAPDEPVDLGSTTYLRAFTTSSNQGCGGGSWMPSAWRVTATDPSGNAVTRVIYGGLYTVTQENNTVDDSGYAEQAAISYRGTWGSSSCACWSDGGVARTTAKGARALIKVRQPRDDSPTHLGLVMHQGPNRGKFKVLVNGRYRTTVDLYADEDRPRVVVWQAALTKTDRVKIVNLATPGRRRIDLDAVLFN